MREGFTNLSNSSQLLVLMHGFEHLRATYSAYWLNFNVMSALFVGIAISAIIDLHQIEHDNQTLLHATIVCFSVSTITGLVVIAVSLLYITQLSLLADDDDFLWFLCHVAILIPDVLNTTTIVFLVISFVLVMFLLAPPPIAIGVGAAALCVLAIVGTYASFLDGSRRARDSKKLASLVSPVRAKEDSKLPPDQFNPEEPIAKQKSSNDINRSVFQKVAKVKKPDTMQQPLQPQPLSSETIQKANPLAVTKQLSKSILKHSHTHRKHHKQQHEQTVLAEEDQFQQSSSSGISDTEEDED